MKIAPYLLILFLSISCKKDNKIAPVYNINSDAYREIEMNKVGKEFEKFRKQLIGLYIESESNPKEAIIKIDSFLKANENEKDKYRAEIKLNIADDLNYLKAELYYKLGEYNYSLKILEEDNYQHGETALAIAANYTKLKQFDKAKTFVDSIGKGLYIYDYALGNYYESIGNKKEAIKIYNAIKQNKEIKHYA